MKPTFLILFLLISSSGFAMDYLSVQEAYSVGHNILLNDEPAGDYAVYYTGQNITLAYPPGDTFWLYCYYPHYIDKPNPEDWRNLDIAQAIDFKKIPEHQRPGIYFIKASTSENIIKIIVAELTGIVFDRDITIVDNWKYPVKVTCLFNPDIRQESEQPPITYRFTRAGETGNIDAKTIISRPDHPHSFRAEEEYTGPTQIHCSWEEPGLVTVHARYQDTVVHANINVCELAQLPSEGYETEIIAAVNANDSDNNGIKDVRQVKLENDVQDPDLVKVELALPIDLGSNSYHSLNIRFAVVDQYLEYLRENNVTLTITGTPHFRLFSNRNKGDTVILSNVGGAKYIYKFSDHTLEQNYHFLNNLYIEGVQGSPNRNASRLTFRFQIGENEIAKNVFSVGIIHILMNYAPSVREIFGDPPTEYLLENIPMDIIYNPPFIGIGNTARFTVEARNNEKKDLHPFIEWRIAAPQETDALDLPRGEVSFLSENTGTTIRLQGVQPGYVILEVGTPHFATPYLKYLLKVDHFKTANICFNMFSTKEEASEEFPDLEQFLNGLPASIRIANIILHQVGVKLQYPSRADLTPENGLRIGWGNTPEMEVEIETENIKWWQKIFRPTGKVNTAITPKKLVSKFIQDVRLLDPILPAPKYKDRVKIITHDIEAGEQVLMYDMGLLVDDLWVGWDTAVILHNPLGVNIPAGAKFRVGIPQYIDLDTSHADEGILIYNNTPAWITTQKLAATALMGHKENALNINIQNDSDLLETWAMENIHCNPERSTTVTFFSEDLLRKPMHVPPRPSSYYDYPDVRFNSISLDYTLLRGTGDLALEEPDFSEEKWQFNTAQEIARGFLMSMGLNWRRDSPHPNNYLIRGNRSVDGVSSVGYIPRVDIDQAHYRPGNFNNILLFTSDTLNSVDIDLQQAEMVSGSRLLTPVPQ